MPTDPQSVTIRYVTNLLLNGGNDTYELDSLTQHANLVDGQRLGFYFKATVKHGPAGDFKGEAAVGATPQAAVRHALEKHGVTFR